MAEKEKPMISEEKDLKFVLASGKEITFKHIHPKSTNLIKVNIVEDEGVNGEGIWACVSDEDKKAHDEDVTDDDEMCRVALLRNTSISGIPWGAYVPFKFIGTGRPIFKLKELDMEKTGMMALNQVETEEIKTPDPCTNPSCDGGNITSELDARYGGDFSEKCPVCNKDESQ